MNRFRKYWWATKPNKSSHKSRPEGNLQVGKSENQHIFKITSHATHYTSTQVYSRSCWLIANFRTTFSEFTFEKRQRYTEILIDVTSYLCFIGFSQSRPCINALLASGRLILVLDFYSSVEIGLPQSLWHLSLQRLCCRTVGATCRI